MERKITNLALLANDQAKAQHLRDLLENIDPQRYTLEWLPEVETALKALQRDQYDLFILAARVGDQDGLQLLQETDSTNRSAPVIFLVEPGQEEQAEKALQIGAADYLVSSQIDSELLQRSIRYALELAHMRVALNEMAIRDELTGLYNQRELDHLLEEETSRCRRYRSNLSLVMLDIDNIRPINEQHGRNVGDEVIKWVAQVLVDNLRAVDRVARYSGDEFVLVLPETGSAEAKAVANRLLHSVSKSPFVLFPEEGKVVQFGVSLSAGIAEFPTDSDSQEALVAMADRALIEAKRQGRNLTITYQEIWGKGD